MKRKMSWRRPNVGHVALSLSVLYILIYVFGFDKHTQTYGSALSKEEFDFAPKWIRAERLPYDISIYGRRTTFWNYLYYPVDFVLGRFFEGGKGGQTN